LARGTLALAHLASNSRLSPKCKPINLYAFAEKALSTFDEFNWAYNSELSFAKSSITTCIFIHSLKGFEADKQF
jgi:hypothetical protein